MPSAKIESAFWDTSGIALLCTHEPKTGEARKILARCRSVTMWWASPVEAKSAFMRLFREKVLTSKELGDALTRLARLRRSCGEIQPTEEVRSLAEGLLERCAIRGADALQLAAALVLCQERPRGRLFVSFDERLLEAADFVGFSVLP
jgi:uncharacterized protein